MNDIKLKMKPKNKTIVWKDRKTIDNIFIVLSILGTIFFILLFSTVKGYVERIEGIAMIVVGIVAIYSLWIRKVTKVNDSGIFVGNISLKRWHSLKLRRRFFISWSDILFLKFENHEIKVPRGSWVKTFIIVKTKDNKKYDCVVYDPKGFIQALKRLGKYNLLTKETKEKYK